MHSAKISKMMEFVTPAIGFRICGIQTGGVSHHHYYYKEMANHLANPLAQDPVFCAG
jgi:hypothetical protein